MPTTILLYNQLVITTIAPQGLSFSKKAGQAGLPFLPNVSSGRQRSSRMDRSFPPAYRRFNPPNHSLPMFDPRTDLMTFPVQTGDIGDFDFLGADIFTFPFVGTVAKPQGVRFPDHIPDPFSGFGPPLEAEGPGGTPWRRQKAWPTHWDRRPHRRRSRCIGRHPWPVRHWPGVRAGYWASWAWPVLIDTYPPAEMILSKALRVDDQVLDDGKRPRLEKVR